MIEITFKGEKIHVKGPLPAVGEKAPDFELVNRNLETVTLESFGDKKKLLNIFVSMDTPVCATTISSFNEKLASKSDLAVINISMDLPFAASRFCHGEEGLDQVVTLSAFRSPEFIKNYGVEIADGPLKGLCARALFVLSDDNTVLYHELVPEITQEPDYDDAALSL